MKRIFTLLSAMLAAAAAWAQTSIQVEVHNIIGMDERFNVTFTVEGEAQPSGFDWDPGDDFQLVWGPQKGTSTSIRMLNGKVNKTSQTTYTYILLPKRTGTFQLPAATAKVKGKTITSSPASVEVVSNGQGGGNASAGQSAAPSGGSSGTVRTGGDIADGDLFLRFTLSRTSAVVGEPLTATLKLYQRVNIAGFEGARFPTFNGFWSQETEAPTNVEFKREQVGDRIYNAAVLRRYVLIPQKSGELTIDPAELVCLVNVKNTASTGSSIFDSFFEDQYVTVRKRVTSAAAKVRVSPLPNGAPASFGGGVGDFKVSARLSKDTLKAHDAASLIVTVSGKGNVSLLEAPKVQFPPDFETYDVKVTPSTDKGGTSGSKTFEYPFIPRSHGDFTIAPVRYAWYDAAAGRYVTAATDTVRLSVAKGAAAPGYAPAGEDVLTVDRKGVRSLGEDIRYIRTKRPSFTRPQGRFFVATPAYWTVLMVLAALAVLIGLLLRKAAARRADVAGSRNRRATKMALRRLKTAGTYLRQDLPTAFYEELHKALLGFVSDKLGIDLADQTREHIAEALRSGGAAEEAVTAFTDLLGACEYARYAPDAGHEAMDAHYRQAVEAISSIDSGMKRQTRFPGAAAAVALFVLLAPGARAQDTSYLDSLWARGVAAYSEGQWATAAAAWQGILDAGVQTSETWYNLGNACFKDGDLPHAILSYERALKLDPSDADARYNLDLSYGLVQDRIDAVPEFILETWARKSNYTFRSDVWAALSILAFAALAALILLFLLGNRPAQRRTGFYGAIAALLLFLLAWDFAGWQYRDFVSADAAIVMKPVSPVKSAPGESGAKDLFILHEGTRVKVLDSVGDWFNIELADGRQGWIGAHDIEII